MKEIERNREYFMEIWRETSKSFEGNQWKRLEFDIVRLEPLRI
jgi:hypothetical protein